MKISQQRQLDRFKRSLDFVSKHSKDFAPDSKAAKAQEDLKDVIKRAESSAMENTETKTGRRVYRSDKLTALNALRAELSRVSRTASLIADQDENFKNTFQMPDKRRKEQLVKAAHHFVEAVPKDSAKFAEFELKDEDVQKLKDALDTYEKVQNEMPAKPARQPRTPAAPSPIIGEGIELVNTIDIIMRNKYNTDPQVLEAWNAASALEVTRRRRRAKTGDAE